MYINEANYPKAWALLKNRFEDARVLMGAEFDAILILPSTKANEYEFVKVLTDSLRELTYNLQAVGFELEIDGQMIAHLVFKTMDSRCQLEFERTQTDKTTYPTLAEYPAHQSFKETCCYWRCEP